MEKRKSLQLFWVIFLGIVSPVWLGLGIMLALLRGPNDSTAPLIGGIFMILSGLTGLLFGVISLIRYLQINRKMKTAPVEERILSGDIRQPLQSISEFAPPPGLFVHQDQTDLLIQYNLPRSGIIYFFLVICLVFIYVGIIGILRKISLIENISYLVGGIVIGYFCLAALINRYVIHATNKEIKVNFGPLPMRSVRKVDCEDIKQLLVLSETVYGKMGERTTFKLQSVLKDNRNVTLIVGLAEFTALSIDYHLRNWLGMLDSRSVVKPASAN